MKKTMILVFAITLGSASLALARDDDHCNAVVDALENCLNAVGECRAGQSGAAAGADCVCNPTFNAPTRFVRCQNTKYGEHCNSHFYWKAQ